MKIPSFQCCFKGLIAIGMLLAAEFAFSQPSALSIFKSDSAIHAVLTTDLKQLIKSKYVEQYQPALLQIIAGTGDTISYDVEVRCRGNIRKETCYYPSIRMKLDKKDFSYNKLKWVNVCDGPGDENNLLEEYLAYKLYNIITDKSFDVCLVRMAYRDTSGKEKSFTSYAFVIQSAEELAAELGGKVHEPKILSEDGLQREQLAIYTFFQYMIGNTDWAFGNRHNVETITHPESNSVLPIPYDFDYSGFVNTNYAVPHESIPVPHVTVRFNRSICIESDLCEQTRQLYLEKKDDILNYCRDFAPLENKSRSRVIDYLEDFFKLMEDRKDTERVFIKECRPVN